MKESSLTYCTFCTSNDLDIMDLYFLKRQIDKKVNLKKWRRRDWNWWQKSVEQERYSCYPSERGVRVARVDWMHSLTDVENCECSSWIHFTSFASAHKSIKYILFRHMEICCPMLRNWIFASTSIYFVSRLLICGWRKWSQVKRVFFCS